MALGLKGLLLALSLLSAGVGAQGQDAERPALALRLPLSAEIAQRLDFRAELPVRLYLPSGDGPFPLVVLHHERRFYPGEHPSYPAATRYFLSRGLAVVVPARIGYGPLEAELDREYIHCPRPDPGRVFANTSLQSAAVLEGLTALGQPIDRRRVLHVGVGVGGMAALSAASLSPQGVIGAINFGGGVGGYAERFPAQPCGPKQLEVLTRRLGRAAMAWQAQAGEALPTLWVYAENDLHFGPSYPRRWHAGFRRGGGQSRFEMLPAWGRDGNRLFAEGIERWQPLVDEFLNNLPALAPLRPAPAPAS